MWTYKMLQGNIDLPVSAVAKTISGIQQDIIWASNVLGRRLSPVLHGHRLQDTELGLHPVVAGALPLPHYQQSEPTGTVRPLSIDVQRIFWPSFLLLQTDPVAMRLDKHVPAMPTIWLPRVCGLYARTAKKNVAFNLTLN